MLVKFLQLLIAAPDKSLLAFELALLAIEFFEEPAEDPRQVLQLRATQFARFLASPKTVLRKISRAQLGYIVEKLKKNVGNWKSNLNQ